MTDAEFIAWLKSPSRVSVVLVEVVARVSGVETTRYLSSAGYTTGASDTPSNQHYVNRINGGGKITERLPIDGTAGMSFGDIELDNSDGALDSWFNDIWVNRAITMYVGDMRWARADFRMVFSGIVADVDSRNRKVINIKVRDKLQQLNTAVSETKLGGTSENADRLIPITLGEVHNIEALLIDKATLKYQWHGGTAERLIEVRDNGVPVSATAQLSAGTFTLNQQSFGQVTCSVQGLQPSGVYTNQIAALVQHLVKTYGTTPFVSGDIDSSNFTAFAAAHTQPVGLYLPERENVLGVCQALAASVGAQVSMNALGKLQLLKIALPATGTPTAVTEANIVEKTLQVSERVPVVAAVKIGYCKNWTVQKGLQTGLPEEHKDLYAQEWLTVTANDSTVATTYKLTKEPEQIDTYLLVKTDAQAEASRRLALWKQPRTVYSYSGMPELLLEALGGYQTITHSRFGMSGGVSGQIISVERDWLACRANFEVLV